MKSSMSDLIQELWFLRRDLVSDDFDRALYRLTEDLPVTIHEYPSGEPCWTWRVPEKWTCHEAFLETLDGRRLLDYAEHPLHVVSYSLPYEGLVSREELLRHLHVHPRLPRAIPFVFKYYDRDWGLCASQVLRDSLKDEAYKVVIRTTFEPGTLKVGEIVIPGQSEQSFVIVAHLCHPAMVNDDLSGVVVALDVARRLLDRSNATVDKGLGEAPPTSTPHPSPFPLRYTYRILILPETIGSVAYLSHHEELIPKMAGGLFLEMLGNDSPHALQGSFQPESQPDRCFMAALRGLDPNGYTGAFRTIIDNDERQFNAPGVRVPMLSLSRVQAPKASGLPPYPEYHSSLDTPEIVTQERLEASRDVITGLIQAWERNQYVVNNFKGEIFCSGYGIWIDYRTNPEGHRRLFEIMERCDGTRTVADIAAELDLSFHSVWEVVSLIENKELVWLSRTPHPSLLTDHI
jgi:aminopeptidase-like protein